MEQFFFFFNSASKKKWRRSYLSMLLGSLVYFNYMLSSKPLIVLQSGLSYLEILILITGTRGVSKPGKMSLFAHLQPV